MYLKSLELSGFKSFAKKSSLNFTSTITGIVGPNGSGKSNVAEAFRFVLGEQSIKSLRGKRGEDMIWNGGPTTSAGQLGRANRASVKVVFDNSRKLFPGIDFDEVTIERVVHRDNTNEYLLNGSQVRLKDIVELLAGAHIGATGHHIISQGEADRILSASIRERREMIEDALGLKMYQWKKLESLRKLERTEENMKQVESLRREIAPHIKFLKKQVEKVERAEELRRELITLYKEYFFVEEAYLKDKKFRLESEMAGPKKELAELEKNLERAKKILVESKNRDVKSAGIINLESKLAQIRGEKDSITRESGRIQGEINANRRIIEKEKEKQKQNESRTIYVRDLEEVVTRIEKFESISDAKKLLFDIVRTLKEFISKHRESNDSAIIFEAEKEIADFTRELGKQESRLADTLRNEAKLNKDYNDLKDAIEREKDTNREAEKDVFRIIARQNEVRHEVNRLTAELLTLGNEESNFKRELTEAAVVAGREATDYETLQNGARSTENGETQTDRKKKIEKNKIRLEDAGGSGGAEVVKEFKETEERDAFLAKELLDLEGAKKELLSLVAELDARIDFEFKSGILKINTEFKNYFNLMFGGGHAELTVVREPKRRKRSDTEDLNELLGGEGSVVDDELTEGPEGLEVNVSLQRKKVKGLVMLSGGERALTSIALLFAISQVNPPPFIILDETDAALDEANSKKYGDMIGNLASRSQLILITHNRETMSRAGVLYGVTMGADGASRLLSIAFEEAVAVAK